MTASGAKRIVVHHDDIGANHATNTAFVELFDKGICTSGSVMVPCPWFDETAAIARSRPDLDLGVHLTLNAEFGKYRWRPLTGVSDNGLTDQDGFMWRDVKAPAAPAGGGRGGAQGPGRYGACGRHRRHPSRCAYGYGDDAGVLRHLPEAG